MCAHWQSLKIKFEAYINFQVCLFSIFYSFRILKGYCRVWRTLARVKRFYACVYICVCWLWACVTAWLTLNNNTLIHTHMFLILLLINVSYIHTSLFFSVDLLFRSFSLYIHQISFSRCQVYLITYSLFLLKFLYFILTLPPNLCPVSSVAFLVWSQWLDWTVILIEGH